jgi:hypothetical protein
LVIQDILKNIIKDNFNTSYIIDIYNEEEEEEEEEERELEDNNSKTTNKFLIYLLFN